MIKVLKKIFYLFLIICYATIQSTQALKRPKKWHDCVTIPYPGTLASEVQFSKYVDSKTGIITSTNEHAVCSKSLPLWTNVFIPSPLKEIRLLNNNRDSLTSFSPLKQMGTSNSISYSLASHFLYVADWITLQLIKNSYKKQGISVNYMPTKKDTLSLNGHYVSLNHYALGDITEHTKRYQEAQQAHPNSPTILAGVSRGAMTTYRAHAKNRYPNVKLVILEGCPDSLPHVIEERFWWIKPYILRQYIYRKLFSFTLHSPDEPSPLDAVKDFPLDTPVAFISSKKDTEVPFACTHNLVNAQVRNGHKEVYFLVLEHSSHTGYMMDNEADKRKYHLFMKALHHKYSLQKELCTWESAAEKEEANNILRAAHVHLS